MQIQQISVSGLFGIFDHVIPLNMMDERITIIHGPNGFGKTVMLRMLNGFFNSRYSVFRTIPFSKFQVKFDNGSSIEVVKTFDSSEKTKKRNHIVFNFYEHNLEKVSFSLKATNTPTDLDFPVGIIDEIIPGLSQVSNKFWRYIPTNEILSLNEVIDRFEDILPLKTKLREEPKWLENLKNDIHVRLIESQRLLNFDPSRSSRLYSEATTMLPTVSAYSDELAHLIQSKLAEYGTTSQSLDRTFPARVV
ncbi:MAG: excinuclease, partial [Nostocaceae cyanobacterium]|nr:excinuclease [Nostocaceae cyanobacterium]